MKTTNTELIDAILWSWIQANDLVNKFVVISKLIKKHGRMLFTETYIKEISIVDQNIWNMLSILKALDKTWYQNIKSLIKVTKSLSKDYKPEFTVSSDSQSHNDILKGHISTKFDSSTTNTDVVDRLWVSISGEGRYFKKDIDSDLDKILWK